MDVGDAALALRGMSLIDSSDIRELRFTVTRCGDPDIVFTENKALEDQRIPENIAELANHPLDEESAHLFADTFQVVPAGCYDVSAEPLTETGEPSEMCFGAHKDDVVVDAGETTEVFLMIQCLGDDKGAVDVIAAINHEPELDEVIFDDSKFVCGSIETVCAEAHDEDNDPLDFELDVPEYCDVEAVEAVEDPENEPPEPGRACFEVTCYRQGRADFEVRVFDQVWRDDALIRIEDWLALEGYGSESHTELEVHAYFDGIRYYPDRDNDGYGDPAEPPFLVCEDDAPPEGHVLTNDDCDDADPAVFPESSCDDGIFCTVNDTCLAGVCSGADPRDCSGAGDQCNVGVCDEALDQCVPDPANEGGSCDDGDLCTEQDVCSEGVCGGTPKSCSGHGSCSAGTCICAAGWIGTDCSEQDIRQYTIPVYSLNDVGVWPRIGNGDCDMDTDGDDIVPVSSSLSLSYSGSTVTLTVHYRAVEDGGDHTTFDSYAANAPQRHTFAIPGPVVGIVGAASCNFSDSTQGQAHAWYPFSANCAFAPGFQFRVDNSGDDCNIVGVRGPVQFTVRYHHVS